MRAVQLARPSVFGVVVDLTSCRVANSSSFHEQVIFVIILDRFWVGRTVLSTSYSAFTAHLATQWKAAPLFSCRCTPVRHVVVVHFALSSDCFRFTACFY
jgi:hypothetical protein